MIGQNQPPLQRLSDRLKRSLTIAARVVLVAAAGVAIVHIFQNQNLALAAAKSRRSLKQPAAKQPAAAPPLARPHAVQAFRDCAQCPEMVIIPTGTFSMGASEEDQGQYPDETPRHVVSISRPFAIGKFLVTVAEYRRFALETSHEDNSWEDPGFSQTDQDPVVNVSWSDAKAYAVWLSDKTGKRFRLPSEAEWEYAARGGATTRFWWGDDEHQLCSHANGYACNHNATVPAGSYPANAFGLYDMAGNAWEWTEDCMHSSYDSAPTDAAAWTSGDCEERVQRGGAWSSQSALLRPASRDRHLPSLRFNGLGFRIARTL